jgi:hypothetical protein
MSLKAVELQVALPRTQEVARVQDQQLQRNMHEQLGQIEQRRQLDAAARKRAADVDEADSARIRDQQEKRERGKAKPKSVGKDTTAPAAPVQPLAKDPLRGKHIDISL